MLEERQILRYARQILLREVGGRGQSKLLERVIEVRGQSKALEVAVTYLAAGGSPVHAEGLSPAFLAGASLGDFNEDATRFSRSGSAEAPRSPREDLPNQRAAEIQSDLAERGPEGSLQPPAVPAQPERTRGPLDSRLLAQADARGEPRGEHVGPEEVTNPQDFARAKRDGSPSRIASGPAPFAELVQAPLRPSGTRPCVLVGQGGLVSWATAPDSVAIDRALTQLSQAITPAPPVLLGSLAAVAVQRLVLGLATEPEEISCGGAGLSATAVL